MPSFELDGKTVEFEPGEKILSAAMRAGIQIPHYCYHPGTVSYTHLRAHETAS